MVTHKLSKLPKNTYEIIVSVSQDEIKKEHVSAFDKLREDLEIKGFRKGKVPADIAKKHIPEKNIYEQIMRDLLPRIYGEVIKKENLHPIINPKIEIVKAKEGEDWEFRITTAEKPIVDLNNYKEIVKKAKAEEKKEDIWVPGKDKKEPSKELKDQRILDKIFVAILKDLKVEISDLIIEEEMNQRLSKLVDDLQKVGMTIDSYLKTKNTTAEKLREAMKKEIEDIYKLEFILMEVADQEKITVDNADFEKIFTNIKDPKEKEMAQKNSYYYASILRKQKTIDYLLSL